MTIIVTGPITIDPADRDKAVALMRPMVEASRAEAGCISYGFYEDPLEAGAFRVVEEWESEEALDAHFQEPHMAAFLGGIGSIKVLGMDVKFYSAEEFQRGLPG